MPNNVVFRRPFTKRGQNWLPISRKALADAVGAGGVEVGGTAAVEFFHAPQAASDIRVEWDFDNDGDFSETVENVTPYVLAVETLTGRDWPSLLTGKAGPGKLRATLRNDDDRFNYFNTGSPLVTAPYSLRTGRKLRVRVADAANPDPALLAKDRFRRAAGPLDADELGGTYVEPLAGDFTISANRAVATSEGDPHMALIDAGDADHLVQVKVSVIGDATPANRVGVVYRYVDASNYSLCILHSSDASLQLVDVTAGVEEIVASTPVEVYAGVTVGAHVSGTDVTGYLEGVPLITAAAINGTAELAGIYARWTSGDLCPELDEFYAWSGLPVQTEGILWTGDVTEAVSSVTAGPEKLATVNGEGWLSKLSAQEITPPASLTGRRTGLLAGNALAKALQIHPPGQIDIGDVTTGTFAMPERSALAVVRDVEETEFGFLYETQEGPLSFRSRSHRAGAASQVTFTDDPAGQFHYHALTPYNWRNEVFNRVLAGVSPWVEGEEAVLYTDPGPYTLTSGESKSLTATYDGTVVRYTGHTRDVTSPGGTPNTVTATTATGNNTTSPTVTLPGGISSGDLILILTSCWPDNGSGASGTTYTNTPTGYTQIQPGSVDRVVAKVSGGSDSGASVVFTTGSPVTWTAQVFIITDWIGDLSGVKTGSTVFGANARPSPAAVSFPWGPLPSLIITSATWPYDRDVTAIPSNYSDEEFTESLNGGLVAIDLGLVSAQRVVTGVSATDPGDFVLSSAVNMWFTRTIAIQGPATTTTVADAVPSGLEPVFTVPYDIGVGGTVQTHSNIQVTGVPLVQGDQTFAQVDDYDSQDEHNAIRTYQNSANLFASNADAEEYAALVLAKYADDRPIVAMSFYASQSPAYRAQALRRRVGDRVGLVADNNTGFGITRDFFIESISHRWSHGTRLWETTWELSPA